MSDKTSDKRLLPCPFCGGEARHSTVFGRRGIVCNDCYCEMRGHLDARSEEMARAWNTRNPMDKIVERLEEAKNKHFVTGITANPYEFGACHAMDIAIKIVKGEDNED